MKEPISIKEIFAILIKRGRFIICLAIVFAILGGVFQYVLFLGKKDTKNSYEVSYQKELKKYETDKADIERSIEREELNLSNRKEYNDNSLLMKIDPNNKFVATTYLAITEVDDSAFLNVFEVDGTPLYYIEKKILNQYVSYWNGMELSKEVKDQLGYEVNEKYLREVIFVTSPGGGGLTITAYGRTEEEAVQFRNVVKACIENLKDTLGSTAYEHKLTTLSESVNVTIDQELGSMQLDWIQNEEKSREELYKLEDKLEKLQKPTMESLGKDICIFIVLGFAAGIFCGIAVVWLKYIIADGIENAKQLAAIAAAPYFGTTAQHDFFERMAMKFIGELQWKDVAQAKQYISENVRHCVGNEDTVLLISTHTLEEKDASVKNAMEAINACCKSVTYINDAAVNPNTLIALQNSKKVILAERTGMTNRQVLLAVNELADRFGAEVLGFVLI